MVAVGTAVARRPPHRSRRAELPHRALAADQTPVGLPLGRGPCGAFGRSSGQASPSLRGTGSDRPVLPSSLSLAKPLPSIPSAGSDTPPLFGNFAGTTGLSDFPCPCIAVVPPLSSRHGPEPVLRSDAGSPGFRVRCLRACMGSATPREPGCSRANEPPDVALGV